MLVVDKVINSYIVTTIYIYIHILYIFLTNGYSYINYINDINDINYINYIYTVYIQYIYSIYIVL